MNDEAVHTLKRYIDLSTQASLKDIVVFSDFLSLNEQTILHQNKNKLKTGYKIFGGYNYAERQMVAFIPDALFYDWNYPFSCIEIKPVYPKFAEKLTHRDVLGALMSLGIERSKIGDIMMADEGIYFFAVNKILPYIKQEMCSIRHTTVTLEEKSLETFDYQPKFEEREAVVASNRLDAVLAAITKNSRSHALKLIQDGKVFVNGLECLHNTYYCKPNDMISIRGFGKVCFVTIICTTKKDRIRFKYQIFI